MFSPANRRDLPFISPRVPVVLKKIFEHAHIQRLAKPARSRKKCHLSLMIQQIPDHEGLVNVIKLLLDHFCKIADPYW